MLAGTFRSRLALPSFTYAKLPRAGLGNRLLVWARARVFASLNNTPLLVSPWAQLHLGPLLRGEQKLRWYAGYFNGSSAARTAAEALLRPLYTTCAEPDLVAGDAAPGVRYEFSRIPDWANYFGSLHEHRALVRRELFAMLSARTRARLEAEAAPCLAVHVRMGDFRELTPGEDFAQVGQVRTPLTYFSELIDGVRELANAALPVTVFSDGPDDDLRELLAKPNVNRARLDNPDIVDILLMARAKLLMCSAGSTFSYWSGFLADAPLLRHPDHLHASVRPASANRLYFEGGVRDSPRNWPDLLKQNIENILREAPGVATIG